MILRFKQGASQHGFRTVAEAYAVGRSVAVLDESGRLTMVAIPFQENGRRGASFIYASDLWYFGDVGEIDCIIVEPRRGVSGKKDVPGSKSILETLQAARAAMIEIRQEASLNGPADHGAAMVISSIDGFSAFLSTALEQRAK